MDTVASDSFAAGETLMSGVEDVEHHQAAATARAASGAKVGRYLILERVGSGGMGIVFAAYDPQLDRKVALKLLHARGGTPARLRREAQALAKLHHPNVVAVHDVGVHEGVLFVAMEFIDGQTLGEWLRAAQEPRSWREVVAVFEAAGRGLAAAHAAGVVHRDFKPDNVMLGADGRVHVMDFGLARVSAEVTRDDGLPDAWALESEGPGAPLTRTGAVMGTPRYMSREQFEGRGVDARSDQFSFCVALYEALYDERPFVADSIEELREVLERGEIALPKRASAAPPWLRRVVIRGLAKRPDARWPSMEALLEALLDDPAQRRRRWLLGAGLLGLIVLSAGSLISSLRGTSAPEPRGSVCADMERHLEGIWDAQRREAIGQAFLASGSSHARQTWALSEALFGDYAQRWVSAREQACEATVRGEQSGALLDLRMACLDERRDYLDVMLSQFAEADVQLVDRAVEAGLGLPALEACGDLRALREASVGLAEPTPEQVEAREAIEHQLAEASARFDLGRYEQGLEFAVAARDAAEAAGQDDQRARAMLSEGLLLRMSGRDEASVAALRGAYDLALGRGMLEEAASSAAHIMFVLGYPLAQAEQGRAWAEHADPLSRAAGDEDLRALYLHSLGVLAYAEADYAGAGELWEQALALREHSLGPDHPKVAAVLNNLGNVALQMREHERARDYWERALAVDTAALGPEHPNVGHSLNNLGGVAFNLEDFDAARDYYARALELRERALGTTHPDVAATLLNLGSVALERGELPRARELGERALNIWEQAYGEEHPEVAAALTNLAMIASAEQDHARARELQARALAIEEATLESGHPQIAVSLGNLASFMREVGELEEARELELRALAIKEQAFGPEHPSVAYALVGLGSSAMSRGRPGEAVAYYERALKIRRAAEVSERLVVSTSTQLAEALWEAPRGEGQDRERALSLVRTAIEFYAAGGAEHEAARRGAEEWLAEREK